MKAVLREEKGPGEGKPELGLTVFFFRTNGRDISDRVTSMVTTGKKDMYNIFILYAMKGKDLGHDVVGESGR